ESFYPRIEQLLRAIARRAGFSLSAATIVVEQPDTLESTQRTAITGALGAAVQASLRDTDLAFERAEPACAFDIVLPLAGRAQADLVAARLLRDFAARLPGELAALPAAVETREIHVADATAAGG
ncbi:MAG: hypothetical protein RLW62_24150, partial [Gammaproteobacteria bacterium]